MAKNITIREGDTSKQFTAKKLKMNLVGGGTTNFVPEDEVLYYVDLKDHTFTQSGTFLPSQFNCDGFRQVKIAIPADVKEKTIKANGVYNASDDQCLGYSKVTVSVPGGGGGGPYKVNFFDVDQETILETQNVEWGASAVYHGTTPTMNGMRFVGWNPSSYEIKENTNCFPRFENMVYSADQITDDWVTIAKNCRGDANYYDTGKWKMLELQDGGMLRMQLVAKGVDQAEGENGYANTTWLSMDLVPTPAQWGASGVPTNGWAESSLKAYLDTTFLNDKFPQELKPYLRNVIKYSQTPVSNDYPSVNLLWIPSMKEIANGYETLGTYYDVAFDGGRAKAVYNGGAYTYWSRSASGWVTRVNNVGNIGTLPADQTWYYLLGFCI